MHLTESTQAALKLTLAYLLFGSLWIAFSDQLLLWWIDDPALMARFQTAKGWFYVAVTGAMFYWMARSALQQQRRLWRRDSLTGLLNRSVLHDEINNQLALADAEHQMLALFTLNIDGFKQINRTLGSAAGDAILVNLANELQRQFDVRSLIGRVGADEFVLTLRGRFQQSELNEFALDLLGMCQRTEVLDDSSPVSGSVGVSVYPQDGNNAQQLLAASSVAVEQAKSSGIGTFRLFNQSFRASLENRLHLIKDLRQAVHDRDFKLVYQPQYCVDTQAIAGVEVLLRWYHPTRGWVSPADFIPLAERQGLIHDITEQVIEQAVAELSQAGLLGSAVNRVSINVSALDFDDSQRLDAIVADLQAKGSVCQYLQFEITETAIMRSIESSLDVMHRLRKLGIRFSIDDFGTGYSSLHMLKRLPIDELKIDQSFIRDIPTDEHDMTIARTIIVMAHSLGFRLVAEGVETEAQCEFLRANGCEEMQGFLLARPMPIDRLAALLSADIPV